MNFAIQLGNSIDLSLSLFFLYLEAALSMVIEQFVYIMIDVAGIGTREVAILVFGYYNGDLVSQFPIVEVGFGNLELHIHHISHCFSALCLISEMIHLFLFFSFCLCLDCQCCLRSSTCF